MVDAVPSDVIVAGDVTSAGDVTGPESRGVCSGSVLEAGSGDSLPMASCSPSNVGTFSPGSVLSGVSVSDQPAEVTSVRGDQVEVRSLG